MAATRHGHHARMGPDSTVVRTFEVASGRCREGGPMDSGELFAFVSKVRVRASIFDASASVRHWFEFRNEPVLSCTGVRDRFQNPEVSGQYSSCRSWPAAAERSLSRSLAILARRVIKIRGNEMNEMLPFATRTSIEVRLGSGIGPMLW